LVCPTRVTIFIPENEGVKVNRNRLGTIKYAGWCGGTAARAASYPIREVDGIHGKSRQGRYIFLPDNNDLNLNKNKVY